MLFKSPSRMNVFLQTREVEKIETTLVSVCLTLSQFLISLLRWRNRDLGFLLPLAVTGNKIQVLIRNDQY